MGCGASTSSSSPSPAGKYYVGEDSSAKPARESNRKSVAYDGPKSYLDLSTAQRDIVKQPPKPKESDLSSEQESIEELFNKYKESKNVKAKSNRVVFSDTSRNQPIVDTSEDKPPSSFETSSPALENQIGHLTLKNKS
eukprot:GILI01029630.1.p2 GENE.GILI01029630.1~~GILI01029630.1.p2  ORF type:complete len:138 (-),score=30.65 GILI01029630.1:387-800(-)